MGLRGGTDACRHISVCRSSVSRGASSAERSGEAQTDPKCDRSQERSGVGELHEACERSALQFANQSAARTYRWAVPHLTPMERTFNTTRIHPDSSSARGGVGSVNGSIADQEVSGRKLLSRATRSSPSWMGQRMSGPDATLTRHRPLGTHPFPSRPATLQPPASGLY